MADNKQDRLLQSPIRVGKLVWDRNGGRDHEILANGYTNVTVKTYHPLSPFILKDGNNNIMENIWQASKIYPTVFKQEQPKNGWYWPEEDHIVKDNTTVRKNNNIQLVNGQIVGGNIDVSKYIKWRGALTSHHSPVRYPNGYNGRHTCVCSIWHDEKDNNNFLYLDYITARKKIYCKVYCDLIRNHSEFKKLQDRLLSGEKLCILDVDGPSYDNYPPYNTMINGSFGTDKVGSIEINKENITLLLNNPK